MKSNQKMGFSTMSDKISRLVRLVAVSGLLGIASCATQAPPPSPPPPAPVTTTQQQQIFTTPEQAVDALVTAARNDDKGDLIRILGPGADKIIHSGDAVADAQSRERFLKAYDAAHEIRGEGHNRYILVVGDEEWPMPIPLVYSKGGFWFDTAAGDDEILNRRIGRNELAVIEICRAYVEAQQDYAAMDAAHNGKHEYAQRFRSSEGQHDGLYWPVAAGEPESPLGDLIADATSAGYSQKAIGKHAPFHGYYFGILTKQGSHAPGGEKDYIVDGHMTRGFALVAFPATYNDSGVMTFIIAHNGIVYEKNIGPNTAKVARGMTVFDPDSSWNIVK